VRDTQGDPVSNAIVRLWQDGQPIVNTRTDADGVLESPVVERGEYRLVAFKEGYLRNSSTLQVDGDVSRTVNIESDSVTVTFDVTDDHFSPPEPVQGAQIEIEDIGTIQTLNSGEATASVPVNSNLDVTVSKANYTEVTETLRTGEEDMMLNVTIQRTPSISVDPANDRVVIGESTSVTITNEYGNPVEGASVSLDGSSVGETDANGQLSVTIESEGEHTVSAQADGLQAETVIQGVRAATSTAAPTATATATDTQAPETTSGDGPGFTAVLALVALLVVAGRLRRD
jgi:PGF-CTERM protein